MPQRIAVLLFAILGSATAAAEEFEFALPPQDVFVGAADFSMPLPPPLPGLVPGMQSLPGMPFDLIMLSERLELTPEQRERAGRIVDAAAPQLRALMFRQLDARKAGEALRTAQPDDAALRRHADEQGRIVAELSYLGLKTRAELRALLTEAQRDRLDEFGSVHGRRAFLFRGTGPG